MPPEERPTWPWSEEDLVRLRHILDASEQIRAFIAERARASLRVDDVPTLGLVKAIEIIGEAASVLDEALRQAMREVPWPLIIGMRHRLVHAYFDIDLDIVWATASTAIPRLDATIRQYLQQWDLARSES